jgi:hypothetical protein
MGGRPDDGPARGGLPAVPPHPSSAAPEPRPVEQPRTVRPREVQQPSGAARRVWLAVGLVLAGVATAAVFLTENPLVLRIVLLAVCWAFVLAAFLGGSRSSDQVAAAAREAELRAAYDLELEREVTARHAHQADLESRLRRESEESMRGELRHLRTQLSALDQLQDDLAAVRRLRGELDALTQLSGQLSGIAELRGELAGLAQLRAQLTSGGGDVRAELGLVHTEVTGQLSGEVRVERTVMRAQSVRGPAQGTETTGAGRTLEGSTDWPAEQASPAGWDVDSWTTRVGTGVPADPAPRLIDTPPPVPPAEPTRAFDLPREPAAGERPPSPVEWLMGESLVEPWSDPGPRSPREWLDEQSLTTSEAPTGEIPVVAETGHAGATAWSPDPEPAHHRRAAEPDDDLVSWTDRLRGGSTDAPAPDDASRSWSTAGGNPYGALSPDDDPAPRYDRPSYPGRHDVVPEHGTPSDEPPSWSGLGAADDGPATRSTVAWTGHEPTPEAGAPAAPPEPAGHARLEQILAESGVALASGSRSRRRRHREEGQDDGDDVLARVLGRD